MLTFYVPVVYHYINFEKAESKTTRNLLLPNKIIVSFAHNTNANAATMDVGDKIRGFRTKTIWFLRIWDPIGITLTDRRSSSKVENGKTVTGPAYGRIILHTSTHTRYNITHRPDNCDIFLRRSDKRLSDADVDVAKSASYSNFGCEKRNSDTTEIMGAADSHRSANNCMWSIAQTCPRFCVCRSCRVGKH